MQIRLNGSTRTIPDSTTVARLLEDLEISMASVVVELNKTIIQPDSYATASLHDNDQMELIRFVGGG